MLLRLSQTLLLLWVFATNYAQTAPCNVVARIDQPSFQTVSSSAPIAFSAAGSSNATTFRWRSSPAGFWATVQPYTLIPSVGVTVVECIASNAVCADTAVAVVYRKGVSFEPKTNYEVLYGYPGWFTTGTQIGALANGDFVWLSKSERRDKRCVQRQNITRISSEGKIKWSLSRRPAAVGEDDCTTVGAGQFVRPLADTGFVISDNLYIENLDLAGRTRWISGYGTKPGPTSLRSQHSALCTDAASGIYMADHFTGNNRLQISKLNANGDFVWARKLALHINPSRAQESFRLLDLKVAHGRVYGVGTLARRGFVYGSEVSSIAVAMDSATGRLLWMKNYSTFSDTITPNRVAFNQLHIKDERLYITAQGDTPRLVLMDTSGEIVGGFQLQVPRTNPKYSWPQTFMPDGNGRIFYYELHMSSFIVQPMQRNESHLVCLQENGTVNWATNMTVWSPPFVTEQFGWSSSAISHQGTIMLTGAFRSDPALIQAYGNEGSGKVMVWNDLLGDRSRFCYFPASNASTQPVLWYEQPLKLMVDSSALLYRFTEPNPWLVNENEPPHRRFLCTDHVDSCAFLKLYGRNQLCNTQEAITLQVLRNPRCSERYTIQTTQSTTVIGQTDSTITLRFSSQGRHVVRVRILGETPATDSMVVVVQPAKPPILLPVDTVLCPGSTFSLQAPNDFKEYEWSNGATSGNIVISQPGSYWIRAVDSCGNVSRDTIVVSPVGAGLSLGADKTICPGDTATLVAPSGFNSYQWQPNYAILGADNQAQLLVRPLVTTDYIFKGQISSTCYATDTLRITVKPAPTLALGADTSFCQGDSLTLQAPPGFATYQWSTGAVGPTLLLRQAGAYWLRAATADGCRVADTLNVLPLRTLPQPNLGNATGLCASQTLVLNPGSFARYRWQNAATTPTLDASQLGLYWVEVTDAFGCRQRDSLLLSQTLASPRRFLPRDTALCAYASLPLRASANFAAYRWSNGSVQAQMTANGPGLYWLEATNAQGCTGRDSIRIWDKQCMEGLYVPTAFTPNADGRNDRFRPLLFGQVVAYDFAIYNRLGQEVFRSQNPAAGWDGKLNDAKAGSQVFVWRLSYQLAGQAMKHERGTVVLMR